MAHFVDEPKTLERYSHVMHLTSQASGRLAKKFELVDVLRAAFPAGIIGVAQSSSDANNHELEKTKRGPYAGIVGYLDFNGNLDNAIAIRTMVITPKGASVQAGAGIVVDSDPVAEYNECWAKAKVFIAAVKPAEQMTRVQNAKIKRFAQPTKMKHVFSNYSDVKWVAGPDAGKYLQGQLTQDVLAMAEGESACIIPFESDGKVNAWLRITQIGEHKYL